MVILDNVFLIFSLCTLSADLSLQRKQWSLRINRADILSIFFSKKSLILSPIEICRSAPESFIFMSLSLRVFSSRLHESKVNAKLEIKGYATAAIIELSIVPQTKRLI